MTQPTCPWCGGLTSSQRRLCHDCWRQATDTARLSLEEFDQLPFGVIELDASGNILAFNRAEEEFSRQRAARAVGRNFFTEVAPCANIRDYEGRFKKFLASGAPSEEFSFTYRFPDGRAARVYIVLVRAHGNAVLIVRKEEVA